MRRKEKRITNKKEIEQILRRATICRIAFHDEEYPYIVPMNYGYSNKALYFHSATEGRNLDLLRRNSKVGFEIEEFHALETGPMSCSWTTQYRSLLGTGTLEIISNYSNKTAGLEILMAHHGKNDNACEEYHVNRMLILKLKIEHVEGKQS
ncbi:MAG: pyridoxamine 5'-phosphate oxidase family protein [Bacteroidota bacterium]|nr:pyridoxamine 5'-phosphate oxidase family protein [Bacteroidota bacterium]